MAQKRVWMTWLPHGEEGLEPDATVNALSQVGLDVAGSHWVDDLEKMAWLELGNLLLEPERADMWLIAGRQADFEAVRNRYGLSLAAVMVGSGREVSLPGICVGLDFLPDPSAMPIMLRQFQCLDGSGPTWAAKVVANAFGKSTASADTDFRFNVIAHPMLGQWFEVGPRVGDEWRGVMFGVSGEGDITHHAVGPSGQLPEKAVLEYPTQGIKAVVGETEFTAWSVQNILGSGESYYIKVEGQPKTLIVGCHPSTDEAEVTLLELA